MKKNLILISILASFLLAGCGGEKPDPNPEPIPPTPVVVSPTSINLNTTSISLVEGETSTLNATVLPEDATDKTITWSVSEGNEYVSVVDGVVTALKTGSAVVTAKTVNDLTVSCSVSVSSAIVLPTSVSFSATSLTLYPGETKQLSTTVLPSNATDKSLTYSIVDGGDIISVNPTTGVVSASHEGTGKVRVTTINGKTDECTISVITRTIKGYLNEDRHSLIDGNPCEKVNDGDFVEVTNKTIIEGVPCYSFTYGATVKFNVKTVGYYEPIGMKVNGISYSVTDSAVTFPAVVEDPDDAIFNFLDLEVVFKDNTPLIGDYTIETTEPAHISLVYKYDINGQQTKACSQGDKIIIVPNLLDPDYEVKTITGYTYTTNETIQHKSYFDVIKNGDGTFYFITPFSHEDIKTIWIEVTEINSSLFKNSELLGTYAVVRTYGLSESSTYIDKFEQDTSITFASSGEITYKEEVAYASFANDGVINATYTTSNIVMNYGKNLIIFGQSSSGQSMISPLTQSSSDLAIGIKMMPGMLLKDVILDNFVFKLGNDIYGVFSFYYADELYASFFADVTNKTIITDVKIEQYLGEKLASYKTVFEVFDKDDNSIKHIGYVNDGGKGNYVEITERQNGYYNSSHSLIFTCDNAANYDSYLCKVSGEGNDIVLNAPTRHIEITLNPIDMTFDVTVEYAIEPKTLDIANKTFIGISGGGNNLSVVFGSSNNEITGKVIEEDGCGYYWAFTATFDSTSNELILQVVDVGYFYLFRPEVTYPYGDEGAKNGTRRMAIDDGKLTFIDNISGMTSYWITKNCVVTCDDFHF